MIMIYLSSAFDTINFDILLDVLEKTNHLKGSIFNFFRTYLTNRGVEVKMRDEVSEEISPNMGSLKSRLSDQNCLPSILNLYLIFWPEKSKSVIFILMMYNFSLILRISF